MFRFIYLFIYLFIFELLYICNRIKLNKYEYLIHRIANNLIDGLVEGLINKLFGSVTLGQIAVFKNISFLYMHKFVDFKKNANALCKPFFFKSSL